MKRHTLFGLTLLALAVVWLIKGETTCSVVCSTGAILINALGVDR